MYQRDSVWKFARAFRRLSCPGNLRFSLTWLYDEENVRRALWTENLSEDEIDDWMEVWEDMHKQGV
jgi:hypothetical protein